MCSIGMLVFCLALDVLLLASGIALVHIARRLRKLEETLELVRTAPVTRPPLTP